MSAKPRITERATRDWQELDARHYLHPFTDFRSLAAEGSRVITRARRRVPLRLRRPARSSTRCPGSGASTSATAGNELADAAAQQMRELPYYNSFFKSAHPPAIELAQLLDELTPRQFNHVFFTNSGSEANDTILRMVRRYWDLMGQPKQSSHHQPPQRLPRQHDGGARASAAWRAMHAQGGLPIPGIVHIEQPYWYENGGDLTPEEYGLRAARRLEEKIEELGAGTRRGLHRRAGAGRGRRDRAAGNLLARDPAHLPRVRHPADRRRGDLRLRPHRPLVRLRVLRHRAGLHDDRQGHHLRLPAARRRDGLRPRRRRADREGRRVRPRLHLVRAIRSACAVAIENLSIMRREKIVERVRDEDRARICRSACRELADHPLVGEVRGIGMLGALELVAHKGEPHLLPQPRRRSGSSAATTASRTG